MRRALLLIAMPLAVLVACGDTPTDVQGKPPAPGQLTYNAQCATCHGRKGDMGLAGAKNLIISTLKREEMISQVTNGKGGMMAYKKMLSATEIEDVVDYALTLRKAP
jgi:mono/diheme cytochrome c family protein